MKPNPKPNQRKVKESKLRSRKEPTGRIMPGALRRKDEDPERVQRHIPGW